MRDLVDAIIEPKTSSSTALRPLNGVNEMRISYDKLHKLHKRAKPLNVMKYRLSIQLYKSYNGFLLNDDWIDLNFQQNFNGRSNVFQISDNSNLRIGKNILMNRMDVLNNVIQLDWLNLSLISFKLKLKSIFMT